MDALADFVNTFYKGTPLEQPINTVGTSSFGSADKLSPAPTKNRGGFGGSGKTFSELSGGTGWGGLLGVLGILGADATGNKELADAIVDAGPDKVLTPDGPLFDLSSSVARISIIILGFIFVAVGLSMFKSPGQMLAAVALPP